MYRQLVHIANPLTIGCPLHCLIYYALCLPELNWSKLGNVGGAQMDFEEVLGRRVDFPVCPSGDFVERIWVPIDIGLRSGTVSFS